MNTKTKTHYYENLGGIVCCADHVGGYARVELEKNPNRKTIVTPMTTWYRLNAAEIAEVASYGIGICETCHFGK